MLGWRWGLVRFVSVIVVVNKYFGVCLEFWARLFLEVRGVAGGGVGVEEGFFRRRGRRGGVVLFIVVIVLVGFFYNFTMYFIYLKEF